MAEQEKPRRRGRPAQLSREKILKAALKLLDKKSPAEVSINGVARALKVAPMSLYTHVENRDDLLVGVSGLVLGNLELNLDAEDWESNVRLWVDQVYTHFRRYPQVVKLLGASQQLSVEWIRVEGQLADVLAQAGAPGEELARTANLISQAISFECLRGTAPTGERESVVRPVLDEMPEAYRRGAKLLYQNTPPGGHSLLEFVVEQLLQQLREILADEGVT